MGASARRSGVDSRWRKAWYVDNAAAGTNAGTSWTNAWTSFASIAWGSIAAGDYIYISGGSVSKTYTTVLNVGASGTASSPITITGASDVGHSGTVIIDGATSTTINTNTGIVEVSNRTNLIIQRMTLQNCLEMCGYVHGVTTGTVTFQNMTVLTGTGMVSKVTSAGTTAGNSTLTFASGQIPAALVGVSSGQLGVTNVTHPTSIATGVLATSVTSTTIVLNTPVAAPGVSSGDTISFGLNSRGFKIQSNSGGTVIVQNCIIDTPVTSVAQTDGIIFSSNSGCSIIIQNNTITVDNFDTSGHSDGIQAFSDAGVIRNNFISHVNGGSNNHGIIVSDPITGKTYDIYNNVIVMGQAAGHVPEAALFLQATIGTGFLGGFNVWNNTTYGGWTSIEFAPNANGAGSTPFAVSAVIQNNIFHMTPIGWTQYFMFNGHAGASPTINGNLSFLSSGNLRLINNGAGRVSALGTVSQTTGLRYFEFQLGYTATSGNTGGGIGNASATLTQEVGHTANSIGYLPLASGEVEYNNAAATGSPIMTTPTPFHIVGCAVDFTNSKIWWIDWSAATPLWNNAVIGSQNPVGNVGGILFSGTNPVTGPYFPMLSVGTTNDYIVFTGSAPFLGTVPSGYSAWGGTLDPAQVGTGGSVSSVSVSFDGGASNTYDSFATWQGFGYDTSGVNSNPVFVTDGNDFHIQTSSPAKNAGITVATVAQDKDGYVRPQGASYDIGAYEFV